MTEKHFVIDIEYINELACNIAENVPEAYYGKFVKELGEYLKCAMVDNDDDDYSTEDDLSSDSGSDLAEEEYEVNMTSEGFYELSECDVKDCNAVGKCKKNLCKNK
tara:strand:+ start:3729 stop:4046 length:318 start_codon:yes stop_codon:yes gene_type:complete